MHVGPAMHPGPHISPRAILARLSEQFRQLIAFRRHAQRLAINHGRAEHNAANTQLNAGITHQLIDLDPVLADVHRRERRFIGEDIRAFIGAASIITDHARTGGVQQHFSAAAQGADKRFHRSTMVGVGGVDHRVGSARLFAENISIIEGAEYRGDAQCLQRCAVFRVTHQAADFMARIHQVFGHGTADVTGHAGNENFQWIISLASLSYARPRIKWKAQVFLVKESGHDTIHSVYELDC
ncbi:hypothetical protein EMIT0P44_480035 [Pseudomonas sp. IT-P44]